MSRNWHVLRVDFLFSMKMKSSRCQPSITVQLSACCCCHDRLFVTEKRKTCLLKEKSAGTAHVFVITVYILYQLYVKIQLLTPESLIQREVCGLRCDEKKADHSS